MCRMACTLPGQYKHLVLRLVRCIAATPILSNSSKSKQEQSTIELRTGKLKIVGFLLVLLMCYVDVATEIADAGNFHCYESTV